MLRQHAQTRMDERAERSAVDVATRQQSNAERAAVMSIRQAVAEGKLEADAAAALIGQATGNPQDPASLESVRPSPQRRMAPSMESVTGAKNLTDIPPDEAIAASGRSAGLGMPQEWLIPGASTNDPFAEFGGDERGSAVRQVGEVAGARRRSFSDAPTWTEFEDPITGAKGKRTIAMSDPNAATGITLGPTAEQRGALEGTQEATKTEVAGPARTAQVGAEAQARQDVELAPAAVNARVNEAGRRAGASKTAEINAQIQNAQKIIDFETKKAMATMQTVATEKEYGEWGKQIADAKGAASSAIPIIGQLRALWADAQPELEKALKANPDLMVQLAQGYLPRSFLSEKTRKYLDLLESARPRLARVMGNVGNFTEGEQQRAGFVAPDFLDAANGGRTAEDKFTRMEKLFLAAPSIAQRQRPGSAPITGAEIQQFLDQWTPAKEGDINLPSEPFDILITPRGIQRPGGGR